MRRFAVILLLFTVILLLFTSIGPLIGGLSHAVLLTLLEPRAFVEEGPPFVLSVVTLSYGMGLVPALIVGAAVAWRSRQGSPATLPFALVVAVLASLAVVGLLITAAGVGSGSPMVDEDPVWRKRQLWDVATFASLLALHSMTATIGCWWITRAILDTPSRRLWSN